MEPNPILQLLPLTLILLILLPPIVKIIRKAGYSGWWVLLWFVPIVNLIALWVFAFSKWPKNPDA